MPIKTACRGVLINRQCLEMHLANFHNKCQYSKIPTKLFARTGIAGRNSKNVEYCIKSLQSNIILRLKSIGVQGFQVA